MISNGNSLSTQVVDRLKMPASSKSVPGEISRRYIFPNAVYYSEWCGSVAFDDDSTGPEAVQSTFLEYRKIRSKEIKIEKNSQANKDGRREK